jgi:hypothetical protein
MVGLMAESYAAPRITNVKFFAASLLLVFLVAACGARQSTPSSPVQPEGAGTGQTEDGSEQPEGAQALKCNRVNEFGPAQVSEEAYAMRHGAGVRDLSQLSTSKDRPVEVCGIEAELEYLVQARCQDGTRPFATLPEAHRARTGNVGPGGRCDTIIDLYEVQCPEATYEVYMDLYYCQAGESP